MFHALILTFRNPIFAIKFWVPKHFLQTLQNNVGQTSRLCFVYVRGTFDLRLGTLFLQSNFGFLKVFDKRFEENLLETFNLHVVFHFPKIVIFDVCCLSNCNS